MAKRTPSTTHDRLVATIRVSDRRGREGERFLSPDEQRDAIQEWADAHQCRIVAWFDETDSVSGKTVDREGLNGAMAMIERGQADGLIVAKIDRFARTVQGGLLAVARLADEENPKRFVAAAERIDSIGKMDPRDALVFGMFLLIAQWQWDMLKEGWEETHRRHVKRGVSATRAPYGYRKGSDGRLVVEPAEKVVVQALFNLRKQGMSWPAIAAELNTTHPKPDGKAWVAARLHVMCKNRVYLGEVRMGKLVTPGAHPAIVSPALFQAVQDMTVTAHKRSGNHYLLSGIARCAYCGGRMVGFTREQRGRTYTYYRCRLKYGWGACPKPQSISVTRLDALVLAALFPLATRTPKALKSNDGFARAQMNLEQAQADLTNYLTSPEINALQRELPEAFEAGVRSRRQAVQEAQAQVAAVRQAQVGVYVPSTLADDWADMTPAEQRALLAKAIPVIAVKQGDGRDITGRVKIWTYLSKSIPKNLPGNGGCKAITPIVF